METTAQEQLFDAIKSGDVAAVQRIIMREPDLVNELYTLNEGSGFNWEYHLPPLEYCLSKRLPSRAIAELLLSNGADPNWQRANGMTLLGLCVWEWCEIAAPLDGFGEFAPDAEFRAQCKRNAETTNACYRQLFELLVKYGAAVNATDARGWTPLHSAACWGKLDAVEALLQAGANRALKSSDGRTPQDMAQGNHHAKVVQLLSQ